MQKSVTLYQYFDSRKVAFIKYEKLRKGNKQCFLLWKKTSAKRSFCRSLQWFMYNFYHKNYIYVNSPALGWCHPQFGHLSRKKTLKDIKSLFPKHNHKKRKDSLKTRAILLIFLLETKISGVAIQKILQNIKKWLLSLFQWRISQWK